MTAVVAKVRAGRAGFAAAALALLLSACAVQPERVPPTAAASAQDPGGAAAMGSDKAGKDKAGKFAGRGHPGAPQTSRRQPLSEASQALLAEPASLTGFDREALRAALGEPNLLRRDPPAEIWQYRAGGCVLDVVMYEGEGVAHAEARSRPSAAAMGIPSCLQALLAQPAATVETAEKR